MEAKMSKKLRVAVLYGGRSGEHEVSLRSAASVLQNLDPERFTVVPVGIDKQGRWHLHQAGLSGDLPGAPSVEALPVPEEGLVVLPPYGAEAGAAPVLAGEEVSQPVDVVFPAMHGPLCEDGSIQGLLELADVPYVGAGVLGSAVGMDKDVAKRLVREAGLPVGPYLTVRRRQWLGDRTGVAGRVAAELGYPVFVKPANLGSSVGIHRVAEASALDAAVDDALRYDLKLLIEKGLDAREIELSVLESLDEADPPVVSVPGEIEPTHAFYSYEAKYIDETGAHLVIPAPLTGAQQARARELAGRIFTLLECEGMARVDLFLDRQSGELLFNEINTIPGFTTISMYPKLLEASGIPYRQLLSHLIELALRRHARRGALVRQWEGS
jgi:D-alanine-D-alanine ligase